MVSEVLYTAEGAFLPLFLFLLLRGCQVDKNRFVRRRSGTGCGIFRLLIGVVSLPVRCVYVYVCVMCVFMCVLSFLRLLHFYVGCLCVQTYQFNIWYHVSRLRYYSNLRN